MNFIKKINNGKNPKWKYYFTNGLRYVYSKYIHSPNFKSVLKGVEERDDYSYIIQRVDYYNKLTANTSLPQSIAISELSLKGTNSVYFFDSYDCVRYFNPKLRINFLFGDITFVPNSPSLVKSRPIAGNIENSVLFKLDKIRHFIFVQDTIPFKEKQNKVIFRGKIKGKQNRISFMEKYFGNPMCDLGDMDKRNSDCPPEWKTGRKTIPEHLNYKFIMALEGNDVASNLKWVMSSNSIAVMPQPQYETWFMEGTLVPNHHYIEIKPDYSDLEECLNYYITHLDQAQKIINNANQYIAQFKDNKREKIISLLVLQKYFQKTGQDVR